MKRAAAGFTLIEVMIAMAIIAVSPPLLSWSRLKQMS